MPDLTNEQLSLALAVVAGIAVISLIVTAMLAVRLGRVRRAQMIVLGNGRAERDIIEAVGGWIKQIRALERRIDGIVKAQDEHAGRARLSIQNVGIVRYDAFEEMGGQLSFSAALLNDHGDGIVISSINGRTEARTYAKAIRNLQSQHNLSDEEREAIAGAVAGGRGEARDSVSR